ncbi:MAG TPA: hypothetical protein VLF18_13805 [Tahibacter sp.]|uniref:hypothetical protein n=1 Tax=Tahibacter sp. TaxID=2056211 RepID=UPI002B9E97E8|nr:hypothetical protein [Tahibacter sp.]HSX61270.1 hypothetical protein [Tahibacter sp.]
MQSFAETTKRHASAANRARAVAATRLRSAATSADRRRASLRRGEHLRIFQLLRIGSADAGRHAADYLLVVAADRRRR